MVKKLLLLTSLIFALQQTYAQQQMQLFVEDFETGAPNFVKDTLATGPNRWIINNQYDGQSTYPTTTRQDSVYFGNGTISGAPFSNYLHIHDSLSAPGIANANYDPTAPSTDFVYTQTGWCTKSLSDVKLVFFYIAEGDTTNPTPDAYGEIYYSIDGGPWIQTGDPQYFGQTNWRYEQITDPAFSNAFNLRFGFKWVNGAGSQPKTISFGIDDIQLVATYDTTANPLDINVVNLYPSDSICRLNFLTLEWQLTDTLCNATYQIELSNAAGSFAQPRQMGIFDIFYPQTNGFISITIPGTLPLGNCYKVRLVRLSPAPQITGNASACFRVVNCPNTITTLEPVVVTDPDTVCALSVIEVKFYSTGVFFGNNVYKAELSDSNGNFVNPQLIGTFPSSSTYDPNLPPYLPGTVGGLIPSTPAGCNYYIRVTSSSPAAIGSLYGPFCINQCDMLTNNMVSLTFCVTDDTGIDTSIAVNINHWDSTAQYIPGNLFQVQLLSKMDLSIVNTGGLAAVLNTTSDTLTMFIPGRNGLLALGIAPGAYYARIIADSSNTNWDQNGTLINLTIGAPRDIPPIIASDVVFCNSEVGDFTIVNYYGPESEYEWLSADLNNGAPFIWPGPTLLINWTGAPVNDYTVRVREINFGCAGGYSDANTVNVISVPTGAISGEDKVCLGDTVQFQFPFQAATYYSWTATEGNVIDTANNQISMTFDSIGSYTVSINSLNECGSASGSLVFTVLATLEIRAGLDTSVCAGQPVELKAYTDGFSKSLITRETSAVNGPGFMFDITCIDGVTINSLEANFNSAAIPADVRIYTRAGSHDGFEQDSTAWTFVGEALGINPNMPNTLTPIPIPMSIAVAPGDTQAFYITTTNNARMRYITGTAENAIYATDGIMNIHEGTLNFYPFAAQTTPRMWSGKVNYFTYGGVIYNWSTGDSTATTIVRPVDTTEYTVSARDTTGCGNFDRIMVNVKPGPPGDAGDSVAVCLGATVNIQATAGAPFTWTPTTGLSDPNSLTPTVTPDTSVNYVLSITNAEGCNKTDTLRITVNVAEEALDSPVLCTNESLLLELPEGAGNVYTWSTGETGRSIVVTSPGIYSGLLFNTAIDCPARYIFEVDTLDCSSIIQVPTAFTPNDDGLNDHFTLFGKNIVEYHLEIYNRWGELVYITDDVSELNDLTKGWDGTHRGTKQNMAAFVYHLKGRNIENVITEKSGSFTLVR